jgi:Cu-Zn family superoxide dismutase
MSRIERLLCRIWRFSFLTWSAFAILACGSPGHDAVEPIGSARSPPLSLPSPTPARESDGVRASQQRVTSTYTPAPGERSFASAATSDSGTNAVAHAEMRLIDDDSVIGTVAFYSSNAQGLEIIARLSGLAPGLHGIHIHENGDCSGERASAAGEHFSPNGALHGSPATPADSHHAGDLGNLLANESGNAEVFLTDEQLSWDSPFRVVDRAVVVHDNEDDMTSQPSGNSGDPVACGIIRSMTEGADIH